MNILTVVGARPQFIKAEPLARAVRETGCEHTLVHTGQHWDDNMSAVFFRELNIAPARVNLNVGSGSHGDQTGRMLMGLENVIVAERPDWVVVLGDTNSTLAGALAAVKLGVPLAHVEAGLRSFNRRMPEEINRVLTDHAANLLFTPTKSASENLEAEGIGGRYVVCVGDVMYDAFLHFASIAERDSQILSNLNLTQSDYILATIHRAENTDDPTRLQTIVEALRTIGTELPVVLPLHPRTKRLVAEFDLSDSRSQVRVIEPVGYLDMLMLEKHASVIATDSGGVQKEAFFAGVPCVTLRDETEWVELVDLGWNAVCPPCSNDSIVTGIRAAIGRRGRSAQPYGDGQASARIVDAIKTFQI